MKLPALGQAYKENICPYFKIYGQYKKRSSHMTTTLFYLSIINIFRIHIVHEKALFGHCLPLGTRLAMVGIGVNGQATAR